MLQSIVSEKMPVCAHCLLDGFILAFFLCPHPGTIILANLRSLSFRAANGSNLPGYAVRMPLAIPVQDRVPAENAL
jgi:hypothetical protein